MKLDRARYWIFTLATLVLIAAASGAGAESAPDSPNAGDADAEALLEAPPQMCKAGETRLAGDCPAGQVDQPGSGPILLASTPTACNQPCPWINGCACACWPYFLAQQCACAPTDILCKSQALRDLRACVRCSCLGC